jgi:hypothetical protein
LQNEKKLEKNVSRETEEIMKKVDVSRETSTFFIISSVSRETFFSSFFSFCKFSIETARKCDILNKKTDRK